MHHVSTKLDVVDSYIRRLEYELDRAHQRSDRLEEKLAQFLRSSVSSSISAGDSVQDEPQPTHRRMSLSDARKAVERFEHNRVKDLKEEINADKISEAISSDASRGEREPSRGRAV
jgi:Rad3-related DNA helicase